MSPFAPWLFFVLAAVVLLAQVRMVWAARDRGASRREIAVPTGGVFAAAVALTAVGLLAYAGPPQ